MHFLLGSGLSNPIHLVALLFVLAIWIGPAILAGRIAERKGRSFAVYLIASLLIGWPISLLAALLVPRRRLG
jgi:hypothetical protein